MAVAVVVVAVARRIGRARKSTCVADFSGMPPLPPFDGRPASSAAIATVAVGTEFLRASVTQTGGGGSAGGGGQR